MKKNFLAIFMFAAVIMSFECCKGNSKGGEEGETADSVAADSVSGKTDKVKADEFTSPDLKAFGLCGHVKEASLIYKFNDPDGGSQDIVRYTVTYTEDGKLDTYSDASDQTWTICRNSNDQLTQVASNKGLYINYTLDKDGYMSSYAQGGDFEFQSHATYTKLNENHWPIEGKFGGIDGGDVACKWNYTATDEHGNWTARDVTNLWSQGGGEVTEDETEHEVQNIKYY